MTNPYELLLSPFKIGNVTLKNRIMGSMSISEAEARVPYSWTALAMFR